MANANKPIKRYKVVVEGLTPLMTDSMSEDVIWNQLVLKNRPAPKTDQSREQIASAKLYVDTEGRLVMPSENLFACLREAGRYVILEGKKKVSTADSTVLPAVITLQELVFPLMDPDSPDNAATWRPDVRRGQLDSGGKKVAVGLVRPRFEKWSFVCTIEVDTEELDITKARSLFDIAGKRVGLCSFRPQCNGPFGRFAVKEWVEVADNN